MKNENKSKVQSFTVRKAKMWGRRKPIETSKKNCNRKLWLMDERKQASKENSELSLLIWYQQEQVASAFIEGNAPCKRVDGSRNNTPPALSTGS